ncbi:MAG: YhjD/YihY/BrkB family envelope integrity protein [Ilumatobacteraceae bacterium]
MPDRLTTSDLEELGVVDVTAPMLPEGDLVHAGVDRGREATGPWRIPRAGWTDIAVRVKDEWGADHVGLAAAGVAFYAFLSLFPALVATVSILGLVSQGSDPSTVIDDLFGALPPRHAMCSRPSSRRSSRRRRTRCRSASSSVWSPRCGRRPAPSVS